MYALWDNKLDCVDLYFNDDDMIEETPVGCYVAKALKTMRDSFCVFSSVEKPYFNIILGHEVEYNSFVFPEEDIIDNDKLNNAKHAKVE